MAPTSNSRLLLGALAALCAYSATPAGAAVFTFETDPLAATTPFSSTSAGLTATFSGSSFGDPGAFEISYNGTSGPFRLYSGLDVSFLSTALMSIDPSSPLTITFSQAVTALSLNFALAESTGSLLLSTNTGTSATVIGAVPTGYSYAEGVLNVSGPAFTVATLRTTATGLAVDNINATVSAVPEPATLALLGTGLAGVVLRRRRR